MEKGESSDSAEFPFAAEETLANLPSVQDTLPSHCLRLTHSHRPSLRPAPDSTTY